MTASPEIVVRLCRLADFHAAVREPDATDICNGAITEIEDLRSLVRAYTEKLAALQPFVGDRTAVLLPPGTEGAAARALVSQ